MKRSFSVSLDVGWLLPPSRWFLAAAVALVLHSALPTESPAVPLPPRSATASAEASFEGITVGPFLSMLPGNGFVDEMALAFVPGDPSPLANSAWQPQPALPISRSILAVVFFRKMRRGAAMRQLAWSAMCPIGWRHHPRWAPILISM